MNDSTMPWFSVDNHVFSQPDENLIFDAKTIECAEDIVYLANRLHEVRFSEASTKGDYDSLCTFFLVKIQNSYSIEGQKP